jgi:hypothetical protein
MLPIKGRPTAVESRTFVVPVILIFFAATMTGELLYVAAPKDGLKVPLTK